MILLAIRSLKIYEMKFFVIVCLYYLFSVANGVDHISSDINIKSVDRTIDISSQLAKVSSKITFENVGKSPVKSILLALESSQMDKLAYIGARDTNKELKLVETKVAGYNYVNFWRIDLKSPLTSGETVDIFSEAVYTNALTPFPVEITQQESQYVKYIDNLYFYSPYYVSTQKTNVILNSKTVENFTKVNPFTSTDNGIIYGPYTNIGPFSSQELSIHYKNNSPFLTVTRLERLIEVSHWGNIAIEEKIEVVHSGAKLKGPFSRYDYQHDHNSGRSSVRSYKTLLPASATDVYYRDSNGNISTSNMKVKKDAVELELRPRYPLFGGWKTHYTIGYNVPTYEYLFSSGNQFMLKMRLVDHVFDDMFIEVAETKIVLPEGSSNIKINTPYSVKRLPDTLHFTYLDVKGRPVITLTKRNIVENHIQDFQVRYTFPRILMFQEPLLIIGFLFALFMIVIVWVRLDFSIHPPEHQHKD